MLLTLIRVVAHLLALMPIGWLIYAAITAQLGGDPQEKMLHELGLWGLIFLLLSLSMTPARTLIKSIPWIKFRRMLGLYCAFYITLHFACYLIFYLGFGWTELIAEVSKRPYITVGVLAYLGLIPLVLTSTKRSQKSLGRKWKQLHKLVYFIAALGLIHFIWQSKSDLNEPFVYLFWALVLTAFRIYGHIKRNAIIRKNSHLTI